VGFEWELGDSATTQDLFAVWGDDRGLIAVGNAGTIVRSTDKGRTWQAIPSGTTSNLYAVVQAGSSWLATGELVKSIVISNNGGSSFALQPRDGPDPTMYALASNETGKVVMAGASGWMVDSDNFGMTWSVYGAASGGMHYAAAVSPNGDVFTAGTSGVLRWVPGQPAVTLPTQTAATFRGLWQRSPDEMFAVGTAGALLRTVDGGAAWTLVPNEAGGDLFGVSGTATELLVVGAAGTIVHSSNSGGSVELQDAQTTADLHGVWVDAAGTYAVAVGAAGTIVRVTINP